MHLLIVLIAIELGVPMGPVSAQDGSDLLTISNAEKRWIRYRYTVNSSYPYLKKLPEWSKIPTLLEWINKEGDDAGIAVAYSQLVALSRADFRRSLRFYEGRAGDQTSKYYETELSEAWARWWDNVGRNYGEQLPTRGRRNAEAWKLVDRDAAHPLPDYKVMIPDEWTLRTSYGAGDYDGRQTERLTLGRSREKAILIRAVRLSTRGPLEWEQWEPLSTEQADNFAFAMAYAIDNPKLVNANRDNHASTPVGQPEWLTRRLEGRNLTLYYPNFHYEFVDRDGNVWWNDDPHDGSNMMDIIGSICRLIWRTFPDNSATNAASLPSGSWKPLKAPDGLMLQLIAEDLALRGEIINTLWNEERISHSLELLIKAGTSKQLSAVSQFETELPLRMKKVKTIVERDPNAKLLKRNAERLLANAAKAKAAIQGRRAEK